MNPPDAKSRIAAGVAALAAIGVGFLVQRSDSLVLALLVGVALLALVALALRFGPWRIRR